jgi:hypothetical protein
VLAGLVKPDEVGLLGGAELRRFAPQPAFGFGDFHTSRVRILIRSDSNSAIMAGTVAAGVPHRLLDLHGGQLVDRLTYPHSYVEQQSPDRVGRVV